MERKKFILEFLGALGAENIEWHEEAENFISGRVIYERDDPEEIQDFCWHTSEEKTPSNNVFEFVRLLNKENLLIIDQISETRESLLLKFNKTLNFDISHVELANIIDELEEIEVSMVDDGKETDIYFIHE